MIPSLALALAVSTMAAPPRAEVRRYALVIGVNESEDAARPPLRYADDDAARFFELVAPLTKKAELLAAFDRDSQEVFARLVPSTKAPTLSQVLASAATIERAIAEDAEAGFETELYFFYAGHGDVDDGEGFLTLADGRLRRRDLEGALIRQTRARTTHVIIDACKSYFMVAGRGPGGERAPSSEDFAGPRARPGVGYALSTSNDAESHEWTAIAGGIFSHEIRSALLGAADADGDGRVDYRELGAFVAVANEAIEYPRYRPSVFVLPPREREEAALVDLGAIPRAQRLVLDEDASGRVSISDQRGLRYADVNKTLGTTLELVLLGDQRYEVSWRGVRYEIRPGPTPKTLRLTELRGEQPTIAARSEAHRAFDRLFERPFSPDVVRGFRLGARSGPDVAEANVDAGSARAPWVLGLGAGGIAAIAGATILEVLAMRATDQAVSGPQVELDDGLGRARTLHAGAGVALAAGVGALAGALVLHLTE